MSGASWLGIDLGGTTIKWEQVADTGRSIASGRVATPAGGTAAVTAAIATIVTTRVAGGDLRGVGIAVPGHLSTDRSSVTVLPNVPGDWRGFPLASELRTATGSTPTLLNDARAFAVAELQLGAARAFSDVVFVTIGTGIGGAIAVDGAVVRSRRDTVGELGHTIAVVDGELCTCGHRGCVEAYAGGAQILLRAQRQGIAITPGPEALPALLAQVPDSQAAASVLSTAYDALAVGVSNACALSGAEAVVVGGGVADELPGFVDRIRYRLEGRRDLLGLVDVRRGLLGIRAGALGAALTAQLEFDSRPAPAERVA